MARVNWKYVLKDQPGSEPDKPYELTALWAPVGLRNLFVGTQANTACLWAEVDPKEACRWYRVYAVSTGKPVPDGLVQFIGRSIQTVEGRASPAPVDNSVHHYYFVDESALDAAVALQLPKLGPEAGKVIPFPLWAVETAGAA